MLLVISQNKFLCSQTTEVLWKGHHMVPERIWCVFHIPVLDRGLEFVINGRTFLASAPVHKSYGSTIHVVPEWIGVLFSYSIF